MKKTSIALSVVLAALIALGGIAIGAQQSNPAGSIRVKNEEVGLADMAKISINDAISAALEQVQGKVLRAELENQDGFLIFGVEIATADHKVMDVKVDAGNGMILSTHKDQQDREGREVEDSDKGRESENSENNHEAKE